VARLHDALKPGVNNLRRVEERARKRDCLVGVERLAREEQISITWTNTARYANSFRTPGNNGKDPLFSLFVGPDSRTEMFEHMNSLTNAMVCEDVQACMAHAGGDEAAGDGPIGVVGYCMSGPFAFAAAAAFPDRVAAAASLHGVRLCTLAGTGVRYRIEWYPGTHHGFVFPLRAGMYEKVSAERHWERLFDLFGRNLRSA
jgi:dienelactone hydrolase